MKKCETQLEGVKKRQSELSSLDPEIISPYEMESLQSNFMDLQRKVCNILVVISLLAVFYDAATACLYY